VNYAKLLEMNSFFTCHIFSEVGKTQDLSSKIWQTLGDTLKCFVRDFDTSLVMSYAFYSKMLFQTNYLIYVQQTKLFLSVNILHSDKMNS
jgi:hypothetical protein